MDRQPAATRPARALPSRRRGFPPSARGASASSRLPAAPRCAIGTIAPPWRLASESAMLSEAAPVYIPATTCQLASDASEARRHSDGDAVTGLATIACAMIRVGPSSEQEHAGVSDELNFMTARELARRIRAPRAFRGRGDAGASRSDRARQSRRQRHRHPAAGARPGSRSRRRRRAGARRRRRSAARSPDRPQGHARHQGHPHHPGITDLPRFRPGRERAHRRADAGRRGDSDRQDECPGVRRGIADVQHRLRHDAQSLRPVEDPRWLLRWGRRRPGHRHAPHRGRQRPRRLAPQPRWLLQCRRISSVAGARTQDQYDSRPGST